MSKAKTKRATDGAEDLEILQPSRTIEIAGRKLTLREYGFMEGLEVQRDAAPILAALTAATEQPDAVGFETIMDVLATHPAELTSLIARSADVEVEWLRDRSKISDADGQNLLMTWWMVNGGFFVRRIVRRLAIANAAKASAGPMSSSASATTTSSAASTNSGGSPAGS